MADRTYRQAVQITVRVEASNQAEAERSINLLKQEIRNVLPTGAVFDGSLNQVTPE